MGVSPSEFRSWSDSDRAELMENEIYKRSICQRCGSRHDDYLDDDGFPLDPPPFVPVNHQCRGCMMKHAHEQSRGSTSSDDPTIRTVLVPAEIAARMERPPDS